MYSYLYLLLHEQQKDPITFIRYICISLLKLLNIIIIRKIEIERYFNKIRR